MKNKNLEQIADTIAKSILAKKAPLPGCGSSSSSQNYTCAPGYQCWSSYYCGGAGNFTCNVFLCEATFNCPTDFDCSDFTCNSSYY